jgi:hypothetical protein
MSRTSWRVALVCLLLIVAAGCSGGDEGGSATDATGAATASTGATGATAATAATGATGPSMLLENGPLEPGTYSFDGFGEPFSITLGEGWEAFVFEGPGEKETELGQFFALFNADHPAANIAFVQPTRMVDPAKDWDEEGNLISVADDLVAWFEQHPMHDAQRVFDTSVAERPGSGVDLVVVDVPKNGWPGCGGACVVWAPISVEHEDGPLTDHDLIFGGALDEVDREIVIVVGGQQLLIDIGAGDRKSFDAFLPLAEEVLATVQIG